MRRNGVGTVALAAGLALAGCSSRTAPPPVPPYAVRPGFAPGLRLRPAPPPGYAAPAAPSPSGGAYVVAEGGAEASYGPSGDEGSAWGPGEAYGAGGPCPAGAAPVYAGPSGAVPPGVRAPSDAPVLQPASPYRGPADPPDVYRRPGTASGNDVFRAR